MAITRLSFVSRIEPEGKLLAFPRAVARLAWVAGCLVPAEALAPFFVCDVDLALDFVLGKAEFPFLDRIVRWVAENCKRKNSITFTAQ